MCASPSTVRARQIGVGETIWGLRSRPKHTTSVPGDPYGHFARSVVSSVKEGIKGIQALKQAVNLLGQYPRAIAHHPNEHRLSTVSSTSRVPVHQWSDLVQPDPITRSSSLSTSLMRSPTLSTSPCCIYFIPSIHSMYRSITDSERG